MRFLSMAAFCLPQWLSADKRLPWFSTDKIVSICSHDAAGFDGAEGVALVAQVARRQLETSASQLIGDGSVAQGAQLFRLGSELLAVPLDPHRIAELYIYVHKMRVEGPEHDQEISKDLGRVLRDLLALDSLSKAQMHSKAGFEFAMEQAFSHRPLAMMYFHDKFMLSREKIRGLGCHSNIGRFLKDLPQMFKDHLCDDDLMKLYRTYAYWSLTISAMDELERIAKTEGKKSWGAGIDFLFDPSSEPMVIPADFPDEYKKALWDKSWQSPGPWRVPQA